MLVLILALAAATLDYFWGLQQRLSQRQALLLSATEDLEHQLSPMIVLLQFLQQQAAQQLAVNHDAKVDVAADAPAASPTALAGAQWSLTSARRNLTAQEVAMLLQLRPLMALSQQTVAGVKQLSYLSSQGIWYQAETPTGAVAEQNARQYWQQFQQHLTQNMQQQLTRPAISLRKVTTTPARYVLAIGIFRQSEFIGELIVEFDLPSLLKKTAKAQLGSQLRLFDEGGELLLAVAHGEVLAERKEDLSMHHGEQLKMLSQLPLSLHIAPDHRHTLSSELLNFLIHFLLFFFGFVLLLSYCRRRFRTKVLSPFQRLLVHIDRLARGDAQGVRNVPTDWQLIFRQVDKLKVNPSSGQATTERHHERHGT